MDDLGELIRSQDVEGVRELCSLDEGVRKVCLIEKSCIELDDKVRTWEEIWGGHERSEKDGKEKTVVAADDSAAEWGDLNVPSEPELQVAADGASHLDLGTFVSQPLLTTALDLAASARLDRLIQLCTRHTDSLWPSRFDLIEALPEWEEPETYLPLLPRADNAGRETKWETRPWRTEPEFLERVFSAPPESDELLDADALTAFYKRRIEHIASMGLISIAFSLVQHCAAMDIRGLEELGEELSLLSRLAYDKSTSSTSTAPAFEDEELTLDRWRAMTPQQIISAYLANTTPSTVASAVKRLVLPYLSVLESQLERAGSPDPVPPTRLLYDYILSLPSSLPPQLQSLVAIFEASKPTLSKAARIVKSDEDLARLAIASLYGCRATDADSLVLMSKVFECLPAFNDSAANPTSRPPRTILSLFPPHSELPSPASLFGALQPFAPNALSVALDTLDLHLTTAETFSRYSCPVPLSWFLLTHRDSKAQRAWATRMARTSASGGGGRAGNEAEFESEDEWVALMEEMVSLTEGKDRADGMKKAFWLLEREEVLRIFFGGLLASGRVALAKSLLQPSSTKTPLDASIVQELVISASREFYDNAESGNLHEGDMKLAFETLSAAAQTPEIRKERDFIEATSKLCSFKLHAHPGVPLTPIEIRHSKDRLGFVARLLASNEDAYRHPDMILELVAKLGYRGDKLAEIRTLAMISDSSIQAGDFERASEICDRMVKEVEGLRRAKDVERNGDGPTSAAPSPNPATPTPGSMRKIDVLHEAADSAWRNCFQLGKHEAFDDIERRLRVLGQALVLCPSDKISVLLPVWTSLEEQVLARADEAKARAERMQQTASTSAFAFASNLMSSAAAAPPPQRPASPPHSSRPDSRQGHDTAAAAQRTLSRAAGAAASFFPFGGQHQHHQSRAHSASPARTAGQPPESAVPDRLTASPTAPARGSGRTSADLFSGLGGREDGLRAGISSRFTKGVGWLIGADEERERQREDE